MDLSSSIVAVFCLVDGTLKMLTRGQCIRARGPCPILSDAEVLTMEIVGEYLRMDQDKQIFAYFRRQFGDLFPNIGRVHRTTFVRQGPIFCERRHRNAAPRFQSHTLSYCRPEGPPVGLITPRRRW